MSETNERRQKVKLRKRTHKARIAGEMFETVKVVQTSPERAEGLQIVRELAQAFAGTIEFYKSKPGGELSDEDAVKKAESMNQWRREQVKNIDPQKIEWGDIAAVAEADPKEALALWGNIREAATEELESGARAAKIAGYSIKPYALAQFAAIRDSFADEWQPRGGFEAAMIDMLTVAFSLQMYWTAIAHRRAIEQHDNQEKDLKCYEPRGWKSPHQGEADAIDQAHRLADGYNRQFLRVLRQLRDLRRYTVIIQNNGGQVNVGNQQVNVQPKE